MASRSRSTGKHKGKSALVLNTPDISDLLAEIGETDTTSWAPWTEEERQVLDACMRQGLSRRQIHEFVNRVPNTAPRTMAAVKNQMAVWRRDNE